jgi:hypothetical protein
MPMKHLAPCLALACAGSLSAADLSIDYTARISLGIAPGIDFPASDLDNLTNKLNTISPGNSVSYKAQRALNTELPFIINLRGKGAIYTILAPALVYARNKGELTTDTDGTSPIQIHSSSEVTFTQLGAKLYIGAGFGGPTGWHGELLPYIGMAHLDSESDLSLDVSMGGSSGHLDQSNSSSGSAYLYGLTLGGYYTPESAKSLEFGGRLGYAGTHFHMGDTETSQGGLLASLEIGLHF